MSNNTKESQSRLQWIDQIKGLAILVICLHHFFQIYPEQINLVSILNKPATYLAYVAVDIFFVMAGFNTSYVLASRPQAGKLDQLKINWRLWLNKRLSRLYPTYFLAVVATLLLNYLFGQLQIGSVPKLVLSCLGLAGLQFQTINPGFWFFTVILQAYLVTPLIFKFCNNKASTMLLLGIFVGIMTKIICLTIDKDSAWFQFLLDRNFLGSYFFQLCLGLYWGFIYAKNKRFTKLDWSIATGVFSLGVIIYVITAFNQISWAYKICFDMLFTPFFFLSLYSIIKYLFTLEQALVLIKFFSLSGLYSYQIYLIHQPLLFLVFPLLLNYLNFEPYIELLTTLIIFIPLLTIYVGLFTRLEVFIKKRTEKLVSSQT